MTAYEFARLVPPEWTYPVYALDAVAVLAAAVAVVPLGLALRSACVGLAAPRLPDAPSLPATLVKPRPA